MRCVVTEGGGGDEFTPLHPPPTPVAVSVHGSKPRGDPTVGAELPGVAWEARTAAAGSRDGPAAGGGPRPGCPMGKRTLGPRGSLDEIVGSEGLWETEEGEPGRGRGPWDRRRGGPPSRSARPDRTGCGTRGPRRGTLLANRRTVGDKEIPRLPPVLVCAGKEDATNSTPPPVSLHPGDRRKKTWSPEGGGDWTGTRDRHRRTRHQNPEQGTPMPASRERVCREARWGPAVIPSSLTHTDGKECGNPGRGMTGGDKVIGA